MAKHEVRYELQAEHKYNGARRWIMLASGSKGHCEAYWPTYKKYDFRIRIARVTTTVVYPKPKNVTRKKVKP